MIRFWWWSVSWLIGWDLTAFSAQIGYAISRFRSRNYLKGFLPLHYTAAILSCRPTYSGRGGGLFERFCYYYYYYAHAPIGVEALSDAIVWRLSVPYIGPNSRTERLRKTKIGTEVAHVTRDSDTTFKVKRLLVANVLNSQHAGTGATWRINTDIVMPEQHRNLANKCEDTVNLQERRHRHAHSLLLLCHRP